MSIQRCYTMSIKRCYSFYGRKNLLLYDGPEIRDLRDIKYVYSRRSGDSYITVGTDIWKLDITGVYTYITSKDSRLQILADLVIDDSVISMELSKIYLYHSI